MEGAPDNESWGEGIRYIEVYRGRGNRVVYKTTWLYPKMKYVTHSNSIHTSTFSLEQPLR